MDRKEAEIVRIPGEISLSCGEISSYFVVLFAIYNILRGNNTNRPHYQELTNSFILHVVTASCLKYVDLVDDSLRDVTLEVGHLDSVDRLLVS